MKLNDYQISGSMSGTGVVLWNLGIKENKKSIKMGRNEKKKTWDVKWQASGQRTTTLMLLNSCSVSEFLLPEEKRKKRTNNMGYLWSCLKMQKKGKKRAGSYTYDLSGRVVIVMDEDDRKESKTHLGQVCHFEKTSKQEAWRADMWLGFH